jgi:hypothetical protein
VCTHHGRHEQGSRLYPCEHIRISISPSLIRALVQGLTCSSLHFGLSPLLGLKKRDLICVCHGRSRGCYMIVIWGCRGEGYGWMREWRLGWNGQGKKMAAEGAAAMLGDRD